MHLWTGRTLDNALLNLGLRDKFAENISKLGFVRVSVYSSFVLYLLSSRDLRGLTCVDTGRYLGF